MATRSDGWLGQNAPGRTPWHSRGVTSFHHSLPAENSFVVPAAAMADVPEVLQGPGGNGSVPEREVVGA